MGRLVPYILRRRRAVGFGLFCALGSTAVQLVGPWVLRYAIDDLSAGVTVGKLRLYAGLIIALAAVGGLLRFLMRQILMSASRDMEYDIRNDFFRRLQTLPLGYYQARRTGDLMSRATNDLSAVRMMIGPAVMYAVTTGFLFLVAIVLMLSINVRLTLIALIPLPFVSIAVRYFGSAIHTRFERIQAQLSDISTIVTGSALGCARRPRLSPGGGGARALSSRQRGVSARETERLVRLQGLFYPTLTFLLGIGALIVLWLGSRDVIRGEMTVGEFVAFNVYLGMLSWPMIAFGWVTNLLQRGMASWRRMLEILDERPAINDEAARPGDRRAPIRRRHRVSPSDVQPTATARCSTTSRCRFAAGQTVALVGPTGSGKSTLVSLLPRLHDPPPGAVFIDGVDVREIPLAELRAAIGMVPQEPFLFSETVAQNIAFGVPHRDEIDDILEAATIARLDKDVDAFPRRMENDGRRARVDAVGRTEAADRHRPGAAGRRADSDPGRHAVGGRHLHRGRDPAAAALVMRERTSIIVSHRVSTVRDADLIVVLEDGRIVEQGTHDALVRAGGPYSEMHQRQLLEEELAAQ